jgi:hypothetical protein
MTNVVPVARKRFSFGPVWSREVIRGTITDHEKLIVHAVNLCVGPKSEVKELEMEVLRQKVATKLIENGCPFDVKANHPITVINPVEWFTPTEIEFDDKFGEDPKGCRVRWDGSAWFRLSDCKIRMHNSVQPAKS